MAEHIIIENDLFGISARLTEIDPGYFIVYNLRLRRFEVHNRRQLKTLALVVPYESLDIRTVRLTQRTRRENYERLIKEMEASNLRAEAAGEGRMLENARGRLEEALL